MLCFLYSYIDTELVAVKLHYSVCLQGRAKVLKSAEDLRVTDADRLSVVQYNRSVFFPLSLKDVYLVFLHLPKHELREAGT